MTDEEIEEIIEVVREAVEEFDLRETVAVNVMRCHDRPLRRA